MGHFDPVYLTEKDIEDIASFFQLDQDLCQRRVWDYDSWEMVEAWEKANPKTYKEIREFYSKTALYVWELVQWHASAQRDSYRRIEEDVIARCPPTTHPRVLDFGAGIGTDAIMFAERGYSVVFADVPGVTSEFAKHRLSHRGLSASFLAVDDDIPCLPGTFDIIVCFDVLEHLPNPEDILRLFHRHLASHGVAAIKVALGYADEYPFHLRSTVARMQNNGWNRILDEVGFIPIQSHVYRKASGLDRVVYRIRRSLWMVNQMCRDFPKI